MAKYTFGFVVLHYNEPAVTTDCIDKIKEKTSNFVSTGNSVNIIVVDNNSPDKSGKSLHQKYLNDDMVTVILSRENLGFAKGNNLGYAHARDTIGCNFICVMNNDVMLTQDDFCERIVDEFEKTGHAVIGPHVTLRNDVQNHVYMEMGPVTEYERLRDNALTMERYYRSKLYPIRKRINHIYDIVTGVEKKRKKDYETFQENMKRLGSERHEDIVLHGCCLILTPIYIRNFENGFNPSTFLFREEELLFLRLQKAGLHNIYEPSIDILHLEDVSTNSVYKKNASREAFKCKCESQSLEILIKEMRDMNYHCE